LDKVSYALSTKGITQYEIGGFESEQKFSCVQLWAVPKKYEALVMEQIQEL
jgi:hypothetical protein